jgi:hypothetical protein
MGESYEKRIEAGYFGALPHHMSNDTNPKLGQRFVIFIGLAMLQGKGANARCHQIGGGGKIMLAGDLPREVEVIPMMERGMLVDESEHPKLINVVVHRKSPSAKRP